MTVGEMGISGYQAFYDDHGVYDTMQEVFGEIEKKDKNFNIFIHLNKGGALEKARELDSKRKQKGKRGKLFGVPVAVKDNIAVAGMRLTCASKILENYTSPYSATVVKKIEAEDGVIVGKTNLDEFAMGSSTEHSAFFPTRNPLNPDYVPGGSSGGSASAVAAGLVPLALGSDTGGSVRQPASFTGTFGLRPTYGSVSRYGLVAFGSSLDVVGPITRSPEDAELAFEIISGKDPNDSTSYDCNGENIDIDDCKIGLLDEKWLAAINPEIKTAYRSAAQKLADHRLETVTVKTDLWRYALNAYYIIASSEASSNLSRYDGVRYGARQDRGDLVDTYFSTRTEGFGDEVKRRIFLGTFSLSAGYYDKYYKKAAILRERLKKEFEANFKEVDFILTPTTPELPFKIGEKENPLDMYMSDWFAVSSSLAGLPALTIPFYTSRDNLTAGIQVIGKKGNEKNMFKLAKKMYDVIITCKEAKK